MQQKIWKLYLISHLLEEARLNFKRLVFLTPEEGNDFFEKFTPGNSIENVERPYERFHDYELLLEILQDDDPEKYKRIHKGTPFYFLGWTAFDMGNFEKATFYLESALEEDVKNFPKVWQNTPGTNALLLNVRNAGSARRIVQELRETLGILVHDFSIRTETKNVSLDILIDKFLKRLLNDKSTRTLLTAFYSFILEFNDRLKELRLKSDNGGSVEPIISHLFKGSLIFESVLKEFYKGDTLEKIFKDPSFQKDFRFRSNLKTSEKKSILGIIRRRKNQNKRASFEVTAKIRNTTGHKFTWVDQFTQDDYHRLFCYQINALFFIVWKHYL